MLIVIRSRERDDGVGNILENRIFRDSKFAVLPRDGGFRPSSIDTRCAGCGQLRLGSLATLDVESQVVASEQASRNVVQVSHRTAAFGLKGAHNAKRRILIAECECCLPQLCRPAQTQAAATLAYGSSHEWSPR